MILHKVYVIGDFGQGRNRNLLTQFPPECLVTHVPAVYIKRSDARWTSTVNDQKFMAHNGRPVLEGEIGCALAHLDVYKKMLSNGDDWALILEDDVQVKSPERIVDLMSACSSHLNSNPTVVSLYSEALSLNRSIKKLDWGSVYPLTTAPYGTVAYIINRKAAEILVSAQTPVSGVADWPVNTRSISFLFAMNQGIHHPTSREHSLVTQEPLFGRALNRRRRISIWLGIWYVRNRKEFDSFAQYYEIMLLPRVRIHKLELLSKLFPLR